MRALILEKPRSLSLSDTAVPVPKADEVLVQVKAATTCGTDLKAFLRGHPQIPMPGVFGHEYSGIVASAGPRAPFATGDAVMGVHSAPCQSCYWCLNGQENLCETIMASKVLGSFAEYLLIPGHIAKLNLFSKPTNLSFEQASLLEPLACVAQGLHELTRTQPIASTYLPNADLDILVVGPGAIGLMFVAALRHLGFEHVTLAGRNPRRLEIGENLGARAVLWEDLEKPQGRGFDAVIECTGDAGVWERSPDYARRGGAVMLFGGPPSGSRVGIDTSRIHYDQITLLSPFHFGTEAVKTARSWLLQPGFNLAPLLSGDRALEEGPAVFHDLAQGRGIKYVFRP
jgi:L-iditol 2-dehydrogenase